MFLWAAIQTPVENWLPELHDCKQGKLLKTRELSALPHFTVAISGSAQQSSIHQRFGRRSLADKLSLKKFSSSSPHPQARTPPESSLPTPPPSDPPERWLLQCVSEIRLPSSVSGCLECFCFFQSRFFSHATTCLIFWAYSSPSGSRSFSSSEVLSCSSSGVRSPHDLVFSGFAKPSKLQPSFIVQTKVHKEVCEP